MANDQDSLLIETALPTFDVLVAEHVVVRADVTATYQAVKSLDFLTVRTPLVSAALWVRGLPARMRGRPAPPAGKLVLAEDPALPGWLLLGERPDREIAFGAVGKFWQPTIEWRDVPAAEFTGYAEPGWGKIAANFSLTPYGERATLLSYECRTGTTDPVARKQFLRYWWLIRPFVAHIMKATLRTIQGNAESRPVSTDQGSR